MPIKPYDAELSSDETHLLLTHARKAVLRQACAFVGSIEDKAKPDLEFAVHRYLHWRDQITARQPEDP